MVLPGPEAQQLATYIGWLMHKTGRRHRRGAVYFALAGVTHRHGVDLSRLGMSPWWRGSLWHQTRRSGDSIAGGAPHRLAGAEKWRLLDHRRRCLCRYFALNVPFPLIVLAAALVGFIGGRLAPTIFGKADAHRAQSHPGGAAIIDDTTPIPAHAIFSWRRTSQVLIAGMLLWLVPMAALTLMLGWAHPLTQMSWFFTKAALMTFGGAYAVLPYVYQGAVTHYGWLTAGQMMDGLALGESTPGPLIMVVTFVGFVGGYTKAVLGVDDVLLGGIAAACLVTWFTFLPSFIFILAGGPFIETTHNKVGFTAPLTAITAAVVGVILNLALFFIWHSVWGHPVSTRGPQPLPGAAGLLFRYKWKLTRVLATAAAVGLIVHMAGLSGAG